MDELELSLGERDRCVDDPRTLVVICTLGPLIAQGGARLYGFGELDELVECQPQQVAEANELLQTGDVGIGVEPVCALRALPGLVEQPELFVVADRARGDTGSLGYFADPVAALFRRRAQPALPSLTRRTGTSDASGSTGSSPTSAGEVASR